MHYDTDQFPVHAADLAESALEMAGSPVIAVRLLEMAAQCLSEEIGTVAELAQLSFDDRISGKQDRPEVAL